MLVVLGLVAPTAARNADSYGRLVAFDLASGRLRFDVAAPTAAVRIHAVATGAIVATGSDDCSTNAGESAFAFSLVRGAILWQRRLPGACDDLGPVGDTSEGIVALDTRGGVEGWSVARGTTRWLARGLSAGVAAGPIVVARGENGSLGLIDARTGAITGVQPLPRFSVTWLVTPHDAVFASPEHARVFAIDPANGRTRWLRTAVPVPGGSSRPVGGDGVVVVGPEVYDVGNGRGLWRIPAPIAAVGSGIALVERPGTLEALDVRTGARRWQVPVPTARGGDDQVVAAEGVVALVDGRRVTLLDARSGARRWTRTIEDTGVRYHPTAAIADGLLLVPSTSTDWVPYDE